MIKITDNEIDSFKTTAGGWTRSTLAQWGVPWPPPKGWRKTILQTGIPYNHLSNQLYSDGSSRNYTFEANIEKLESVKSVLRLSLLQFSVDPYQMENAVELSLEILDDIK